MTYAIKQNRFLAVAKGQAIPFVVSRLKQRYDSVPFFSKYLGPNVILVPAPRSTPLSKGAFWPTMEICEALLREGLGGELDPCLERVRAVQRSSTAGVGQRPGPEEHYDSTSVRPVRSPDAVATFTIIDDVITRGASAIGFAARLTEAFPRSTIRSFALVRTISVGDVDIVGDPIEGEVTYANGSLWRNP